MSQVEADRSETVAGDREDQYENLDGCYPVGKEGSVIFNVVQLFSDVRLGGDTFAEGPPEKLNKF